MHTAPANWKKKCLVCGQEVSFRRTEDKPEGDFSCKKLPGNHKVEEVTYFHLGGSHIQHPRERRGWSPQIILRAGYPVTDQKTGLSRLVETVRVYFANQQLVTEDPEIQFLVETKNDNSIAWGVEGKKLWEKIYLTVDQQKDLANAELEAINKRITEGNALLADVQGRSAKGNKPEQAQAS